MDIKAIAVSLCIPRPYITINYNQWHKESANIELETIQYAGKVTVEIVCDCTAGITSEENTPT